MCLCCCPCAPLCAPQAKLADFGLHKRVRKMASSGALVAWSQETTYHGADYDKSFYGGKLYLVKSAMSIASSMRDDDSVYNGSLSNGNSLHGGSLHGNNSQHGGSMHGGASWHRANAALMAANDSAYALPAASAAGAGGTAGAAAAAPAGSGKPPVPPSLGSSSQAAGGAAAANGDAVGAGGGLKGVPQCSDSAASIADGSGAAVAGKGKQQQQEAEMVKGAVRAKSQGLLAQQDFVTRVLSVPSNSTALQQVCTGCPAAAVLQA